MIIDIDLNKAWNCVSSKAWNPLIFCKVGRRQGKNSFPPNSEALKANVDFSCFR